MLEQIIDKLFGIASAFLIWAWVILPVTGYESTYGKDTTVVLIFTIWSIIRGYGTRRLFNWLHMKGYL